MSSSNKWTQVITKKSPKHINENLYLKGNCIFFLTGKCTNDKCSKRHDTNKQLQYFAKNPINIFNNQVQTDIKNIIEKSLHNTKPLFFTSCTFCFRNIPCHNIIAKRFIKFNANFNNSFIT